jgi:hypothetical protein
MKHVTSKATVVRKSNLNKFTCFSVQLLIVILTLDAICTIPGCFFVTPDRSEKHSDLNSPHFEIETITAEYCYTYLYFTLLIKLHVPLIFTDITQSFRNVYESIKMNWHMNEGGGTVTHRA